MKGILVAGTNSGVGKTTISVGIMAALRRKGLRIQPFKVGPDFLDPMHHEAATGRESLNLDGWMLSREVNQQCYTRQIATTDLAVVEGVMGLFDGRDGKSETGSTAEMAKILNLPVILVLDSWSLSRSAAAIVHGFVSFDPAVKIAGIIFNKVSGENHLSGLKDAIESCSSKVPVLGGIPKIDNLTVPERHVNPHLPGEITMPGSYIEKLADLMEAHLNLDHILELAGEVNIPRGILSTEKAETTTDQGSDGELEEDEEGLGQSAPIGKVVRIGVARDAAFCFYYHENLALLKDAGAVLVFFSPLHDLLPPRLDAIYLGGGYPELYARQLAANTRMLYAMRAFAAAGGVVYAECGGLMYLSESVETAESERFPMCGVFPFRTRMVPEMKMGYVTVVGLSHNSLFSPEIGEIRGQLFHFSEIVHDGVGASKEYPDIQSAYHVVMQNMESKVEEAGYCKGQVIASYVHLHFGSNPVAVQALVGKCRADTSKAAAVAAASASAVADSGPIAAAAAGAAAAAAVAEALSADPSRSIFDDEDSRHGLDISTGPFSWTPTSRGSRRGSNRRNSDSVRWDRRVVKPFVPNLPDLHNPWGEWKEGEDGGEELETSQTPESEQTGSRAEGGSGLTPSPRFMRRSMSEYWGSLQTRRRSRKSTNGLRFDSPEGKPNHKGTWGSSGSSDDDLLGLSELGDGNVVELEHDLVYSTPVRNFSSPMMEEKVNGGPKNGLTSRSMNGRMFQSLSDSMDTPSSSDGGEGCDTHHYRGQDVLRGEVAMGESTSAHVRQNGDSPPHTARRTTRSSSFADHHPNHLERPPVPTKIVSLIPAVTEILIDLGVGERLMGVSDHCNASEGTARNCHVVSRTKADPGISSRDLNEAIRLYKQRPAHSAAELDVVWLRKVRPDLIFTKDMWMPFEMDKHDVARALAKADLLDESETRICPVQPQTMAEIFESIICVGQAVGLAARAYTMVDQLRMRIRHVAKSVAGEVRPRILTLSGLWPPTLGGLWLPEMAALAGGFDGLQEAGNSAKALVWENVTAYAPEVIVLLTGSANMQRTRLEMKYVASLPGFWSFPAVQNCKVYLVEQVYFMEASPRVVEGVEILAHLFHPSRVRTRIIPGIVKNLVLDVGQRCRPEDLHKYFQPYS